MTQQGDDGGQHDQETLQLTLIVLDLMKWKPERIKELRKCLGYNQTEMASALGYSRYQSVSDLENGKQAPSDTICRLLTMLDEFGDARNRRLEDDETCLVSVEHLAFALVVPRQSSRKSFVSWHLRA